MKKPVLLAALTLLAACNDPSSDAPVVDETSQETSDVLGARGRFLVAFREVPQEKHWALVRQPSGLSQSQAVPALDNRLYGLITTRATETHARGVTGTGIKVGVADTGLDYTHPDIAPVYKGGIDTVSDDNDPWWNNDVNEAHGTHVAGTIVAAQNSSGVYGVAYSAELYHARVLGPNGGYSSVIMAGVR